MNIVIKSLWRFTLVCLALSLMVGCTSSTTPQAANGGELATYQLEADRVEVVYFHRTSRCYSCLYVEEGTRHTMEAYFADELTSGKVNFKVLNVEDKENAAIVKKYGAFTSSLFINTIKDGTDHIEEATDIWLVLGNDEAFVEALKSKIEKSLKGEV